jgi:Cellulase (glycosyl hydrolase family 5)
LTAEPSPTRLPRWRGFNLQEKFKPETNGRFREEAQRLCAHHWAHFAERYRGVPDSRLTFNLVNEPKQVDDATYTSVVRKLVSAIRARDRDRLIIADGLDLGWTPVRGIVDLGIAQSLPAYDPWEVSHWRAPWFPGADTWPEPTWPVATADGIRDKAALLDERVGIWRRLEAEGVGIHVGEFGTYKETPHAVSSPGWRTGCSRSRRSGGAGRCGTCVAPTGHWTAGGPTWSTRSSRATSWTRRC